MVLAQKQKYRPMEQDNSEINPCTSGYMWYIYTMEYYSAIKRNGFESVLMRWMNLKPIIQSEVSQEEKNKYCRLTQIRKSSSAINAKK